LRSGLNNMPILQVLGIVFIFKIKEKVSAMKRIFGVMFLLSLVGVFAVNSAFAVSPDVLATQAAEKAGEGDPITPDQIIARVEKAAQLVLAEGISSMDKFRGKSEFTGNGTYIWIHDLNGEMIMHPMKYKLDGKPILGVKDPNGKRLFSAMNSLCKKSGAGWVDYMWAKPGSNKPVQKISYVKLVKGDRDYVIGCGIYCDKETADKLLATNPQ